MAPRVTNPLRMELLSAKSGCMQDTVGHTGGARERGSGVGTDGSLLPGDQGSAQE